MDETKGKSAHLAQNGGNVHGQTRAWGHREEEEQEDVSGREEMCAPFRSLFEKGEEEEAGRGRRRGKDVDVDDNDDHTVTDDERIRLVSGLKTRPDSTAFARGVEMKGYANRRERRKTVASFRPRSSQR